MYSTEYLCQRQAVDQFSDVGTIELKKKDVRLRKPTWLVLTKIIGLVGIVIIGLIFIPDEIPFLTGGQAVAASLIVMAAYVAFAHFVRPKANTDNLGVFGVADDQFQYYDDINRHLLALHIALGPGRFIATTVIDACTLFGILPERTREDINNAEFSNEEERLRIREAEVKSRIAAKQDEGNYAVELDSAKYFNMMKNDLPEGSSG